MKKIKVCLCMAMLLSLFASFGCFSAGSINVVLDGQKIVFPDAQPFVNADSRTMVPVRFVSEALGAEITWVEENQQVIIEKGGVRVDLYVGSRNVYNSALEHGRNYEIDTAPVIVQGRTFVPLRFVSETLDCFVDWSGETNSIVISSMGLPMSAADWEQGVVLDTTETERIINVGYTEIEIEKGDTVTEEADKITINKHSGVVFEIYPSQYKNPESVLQYRIYIPKNADLKTVFTDLSDEVLYTDFSTGCYPISAIAARGMRNGIGPNHHRHRA